MVKHLTQKASQASQEDRSQPTWAMLIKAKGITHGKEGKESSKTQGQERSKTKLGEKKKIESHCGDCGKWSQKPNTTLENEINLATSGAVDQSSLKSSAGGLAPYHSIASGRACARRLRLRDLDEN